MTSENQQYGIYLQDDWEVTDKLLLNLGLRYDYEETPTLSRLRDAGGCDRRPQRRRHLAGCGARADLCAVTGAGRCRRQRLHQHRQQPRRVQRRDPAARRFLVRLLGGRALSCCSAAPAAPTTATCSTTSRSSARRARSRATTLHFNAPGTSVHRRRPASASEFDPAFFEPREPGGAGRSEPEPRARDQPDQQRPEDAVLRPVQPRRAQPLRPVAAELEHLGDGVVRRVEGRHRVPARQPARQRQLSREPAGATWEQVPFGNGIPGLGSLHHHQQRHRDRARRRCCCRPRSRTRANRTGASRSPTRTRTRRRTAPTPA